MDISISTDAYRAYIIAAKFLQNIAVQERLFLPTKNMTQTFSQLIKNK